MMDPSDDESLDGMLKNRSTPDEHNSPDSQKKRQTSLCRLRDSSTLSVNVYHTKLGSVRKKASSNVASNAATRRGKSDLEDNYEATLSDAQNFFEILEALMALTKLLSDDRAEAVAEASRIRASIRELEQLVDSRIERELQYLSQVQHQQNEKFERKYRTLVARARQHIADTQQQSVQYHTKSQKKIQRAEAVQEEFNYLNRVMIAQKQELLDLKEATKDRISERDLTEIRIKFLRLQDENSKMQMEKAKLQQLSDQMLIQLHKNHPDKLLPFLNIDQIPNMTPEETEEQDACNTKMSQLELTIAKAREERSARLADNLKQRKELEAKSQEMQNYAVELMKHFDQEKEDQG